MLAIIDQTHLLRAIEDHVSGSVLGPSLEVRMSSNTSPANSTLESLCRAVVVSPLFGSGLDHPG